MPWDAGRVPDALRAYATRIPPGSRMLIPGCGSAYEAYYLLENGFEVEAIDFSEAAVQIGKANLGCFGDRIRLADFFSFEYGLPYDVVYERAFLCALPPRVWAQYAERMAQILRPGGDLAGFFFLKETQQGPPFGISEAKLRGLLDTSFEQVDERPVADSLPVFQGAERWQVWRRR